MRHWIFAFEKPLSPTDEAAFTQKLTQVLAEWKAHGVPVGSAIEMRYGQFLFVQALTDPSGCSMDWLGRTVRQTVADLNLPPLADEGQIFYRQNDQILSLPLAKMRQAVANGQLPPQTIVFDATVTHRDAFQGWETELQNTFLRKKD